MSICIAEAFCYRPEDYKNFVWRSTNSSCAEQAKKVKISNKNSKYVAQQSIAQGQIIDLDPTENIVRDYGDTLSPSIQDNFNEFYQKYTTIENVDSNVNVRMLACPDGPYYEARKDIHSGEELIRYATPAYWLRYASSEGVEEAKNKLSTEKNIAPSNYFSSLEDQDVFVQTMESSSVMDAWRKAKSSTTTMTLTLIFGSFIVLVLVGLIFYFFGNKLISIGAMILGYAVVIYLQYLVSEEE